MSPLSLHLLGPFETHLDGVPLLDFRSSRVQALLIYLAVERSGAHRREQLFTLLWPGMPEKSARHNLSQTLYALRQAFPDTNQAAPLLLVDRQTVQLNPDAQVQVDIHQMDRLLQSTHTHDHLNLADCEACLHSFEAAAALYRGDFLADFYLEDSNEFEDWAQAIRQTYRRKALETLEKLTSIFIDRKAYPQANNYAHRQLEIDNLRERAYRQLMEILACSGQRSQAIELFDTCRQLLDQELGMAPAASTTLLYEKIRSGEMDLDISEQHHVRGYELHEKIGAGAYGVIHRAVQIAISRDVAVKIIHPQYANDPDFIRRFEAEAQTISHLEHPHIVPLYDFWREPDGAFLVMRLLRGGNLQAKLQNGPWSPDQVAALLDQIASALAIAHRQGIVHRDIKPANILFDESGNAYLSDFGIAKNLTQSGYLSWEGGILGSPDYISPEQLAENPVSPQSDIYSLGAVLYELLTGQKPFPDTSLVALIQSQLSAPFPLVRSSIPDFPVQIDNVIQRATAKAPTDRFADVLMMAQAFRLALQGQYPQPVAPSQIVDFSEVVNPYKGLRAFQEADAQDYFGRDELVAQLVARLADSRFLAVVGPSGSGKSSAVKAGLIPALRQGALPGSEDWFMAVMMPGQYPLEELELALWPVAVDPPPSLVAPMQVDPRGMLRTIRRILPGDGEPQLVLVIDQFEELFTLVDDPDRCSFFLESLTTALTAARSPLRVIVTLRADFYDRPLQFQPLADLFKAHSELVLPLNRDELTQAIREPTRRSGVLVEDGLVEAVIADLKDQPGALPLMQYALTELFEARQDHTLSLQAYHQIGGVSGALSRRAETLFAGLSETEQTWAKQLFLRLVTLGEGVEDTRRRVLLTELTSLEYPDTAEDDHAAAVQTVLDRFGHHRLLTFDHDPVSREPTVEVAHEALLREWPHLREWLDQSREDIRLQRLLSTATTEWLESHKDDSFLLRGTRLDHFSAWVASTTVALTDAEQSFLQASLASRQLRQAAEAERQSREQALEQRSRRVLRALVGIFAVAAIVAMILTGIAFNQRGIAQSEAQGRATQQAIAETESMSRATQQAIAEEKARIASAGELAMASMSLIDQQPDLAMLLSVEAYRQSSTLQNWTALYAIGTDNPQLLRIMRGHTGRIESLVFSPDGKKLVSGGLDGTVQLWEMDPGAAGFSSSIVLHHKVEAPVFESVAFSSDGSLAAASTTEGQVLVWDTDPASDAFSQLLIDYTVEGELVPGRSWVTFSPTDPLLAAVPKNGRVELFDVDRGSPTFGQSLGGVMEGQFFDSLAFSPDGTTLATGEIINNQVSLWHLDLDDPDFGHLIDTLAGFETCVESVEFSPGGSLLAAGLCNQDIWVWNVESGSSSYGEHMTTLSGQEWIVLNIAFSPDSKRLASVGGWDESALIWDVDPDSPTFGEQARSPLIQGSFVDSVAYSPDGDTLAVGAADGGILLWDMAKYDLDVSPLAERDRELSLGLVDTPEIQYPHPLDAILIGHSGAIEGVAFSPDGKILASGGGGTDVPEDEEPDYTLRLWDVDPDSPIFGEQIGESLVGHTDRIYNLTYDPDGTRVATASWDGTIRLWNVNPDSPTFGQSLGEPLGNYGPGITDVDFSPNGAMAATCDEMGAVYLWDVDPNSSTYGESLFGPIQVNELGLENIAFSPDGKFLAVAPWGGWNWGQQYYEPIPLYDVDPESPTFGELVIKLVGEHAAVINRVEFHPGGKMLASASDDETIRLWDVDPGSPNFGKVIGAPLVAGHQVWGIAFSPDGKYLVSGTHEVGTLHIWDVDRDSPTFGQPLGVPLNQENIYAVNMAYSPDGKFFAVGDSDFRIHLWNVDPQAWAAQNCDRAGRNLTEVEWNQYLSWAGPYNPNYKTCPQWPAAEQ